MRALRIDQPGTAFTPDVRRARGAIAAHARLRQRETIGGRRQEPLLSWERIAEYDAFRIRVRCDYHPGQRPYA